MSIDLIDQLTAVRMEQSKVKAKLMAKNLEYQKAKAESYLNSSDSHYKALHQTNLDPDVIRLKEEINALEIEHYNNWVLSASIVYRLAECKLGIAYDPTDTATMQMDAE